MLNRCCHVVRKSIFGCNFFSIDITAIVKKHNRTKMRMVNILTGITATHIISLFTEVSAKPVAKAQIEWKTPHKGKAGWDKIINEVIPESKKVKPASSTTIPRWNLGHPLCCQGHVDFPWQSTTQGRGVQGVGRALEELMAAGTNPIILKDTRQLVDTMVDAQSGIGLRCSGKLFFPPLMPFWQFLKSRF